jgi:hypothetical protein
MKMTDGGILCRSCPPEGPIIAGIDKGARGNACHLADGVFMKMIKVESEKKPSRKA